MSATSRVLVTGACGVNGIWVLRELRDRGAAVLAADLQPDFSIAPELAEAVEFGVVDVADLADLTRAVESFRPDTIVHMAALMPTALEEDPYRGYRTNVMGTANVMRAATKAGVRRVVFTSSKAAYGEVSGVHADPVYQPIPETAAVRPVHLYDYAKIASEGIGNGFALKGGVEFAALRFATIYGPGKLARHGAMSLASRIVEDPYAGRSVEIPAGGDQLDDLIYVKDVATATVDAALHPSALEHRLYNVGSGIGVSLRDLADAVRAELPDAAIEIGPGLDPMRFGVSYYAVMDCSRMEAELGFRPEFGLREGVRDYIRRLGRLDRPHHLETAERES